MTSLTDIEKRALGALRYGERLNPVRDWLILLLVSAVLLLVSAAVNVAIYLSVKNAPQNAPEVTSGSAVDANTVASVEAIFQRRAAEQGNYEHVYEFVDPSR